MKEIKGLTERLASLEGRVTIMKQLIQDQADMAQVNAFYIVHLQIKTSRSC